jgi:hypothetical protein
LFISTIADTLSAGQHRRALFLVQRWTGLRIGDALQIRRFALIGNRLKLTMQKRETTTNVFSPIM